MDPLVNKTLRAVISISIMLFCLGTIVWLLVYGQEHNSLHQSALSWSYTTLIVTMAAIGLDSTITKIIPLLVTPKQQ